MACKLTYSCFFIPACWLLFSMLPWLSSSQGLSVLKQSPHSLLCSPGRFFLSIATDVWLCMSALWFSWGMQLGKTAKPTWQMHLFVSFPLFLTSYHPIVNRAREPNQKKNDPITTKSVCFVFSKFISLKQPAEGQMDANDISRNIRSGGGVRMSVLGRPPHLYCKTTAPRCSWWLANHFLSFPGCHSLPPTPDVKLLSGKGMASSGPWGAQPSLSTAPRMCQSSSHPSCSCMVSELCTNKTDLHLSDRYISAVLQLLPCNHHLVFHYSQHAVRKHCDYMVATSKITTTKCNLQSALAAVCAFRMSILPYLFFWTFSYNP